MQTSFGMRSTFFERGIRGRCPGALIWRLNQSCYEGQLAGYLQYLDTQKVTGCTGLSREGVRPTSLEHPIRTTRGDRLIAGIIAGGSFVCASYISNHLSYLPNHSEMDWDAHTLILSAIFGILLGLFLFLGYVCLRVVFAKE
jgi:hypothetical protein